LLRILPLILSTAVAITVAHAQSRADLPDLVDAFVEQERGDADAERKAAIAECLISAFDGIGDEELTPMLDQEGDFEESIDALLKVYPDREAIIEICEDL
jgi:hypothetical protein